jgi:hypothetical protein
LRKLDALAGSSPSKANASAFFSYLVVTILVNLPCPRQRTLSVLQVGVTLFLESGDFTIRVPGSKTKSKKPLYMDVPTALGKHLRVWLQKFRSVFVPGQNKDYLFPRKSGGGRR